MNLEWQTAPAHAQIAQTREHYGDCDLKTQVAFDVEQHRIAFS